MVYFETQRLVFRDWKEQDLKEFRAMNKDTRVMKKIGMIKAMEFEHPNIIEGNPLRKHVLYTIDLNS